jgi:hypothetical protein
VRVRPLLVFVVIVLAVALLWLRLERKRPAAHQPLPPPAIHTAIPALPSPTAPPTAGPEPSLERRSSFVVAWESEPTPSPTPEPTTRPGPSPTPQVAECISLKYSAGVLPGTLGRILVDIRLENRCGRDLGPLDVWFWVGGYRQGDLVQSVRGHPFDPIARGEEGKASIVLPGSIDWYDRIDVQVLTPNLP